MGKHRQQIALVLDSGGCLLGTVTDGDVRRSILHEVSPNRLITEIMNTDPVTAQPTSTRTEQLAVMTKVDIHHLPLVDDHRQVVGLVSRQRLLEGDEFQKPNSVVLLAGGRGERLRPLTDNIPKPLLPLGGRPILETIVRQLYDHGFRHFYMSINHMADQFRDYFDDGSKLGITIEYIEEDEPLGTAGPLGLIETVPTEPLLVMNGDILTSIDYSSLLSFHEQSGSAITVATREIGMEVPYGVLAISDGTIVSIAEKPTKKFTVAAGIYVVEPDLLKSIPDASALEMPDFIKNTVATGRTVSGFPIYEYWLDIGRTEEFNRASGDIHRVIG